MSTYRFISTFPETEYRTETDAAGLSARIPISSGPQVYPDVEAEVPQTSLASFICHASHLENELRAERSVFLDDRNEVEGSARLRLGHGTSFVVERAEWKSSITDVSSLDVSERKSLKWGRYIAIKTVNEGTAKRNQVNWDAVALEIRALLHKYLRYHPNIVSLLGLGWSPSGSGSPYPSIVLEYAEFGSMDHLQRTLPPLPFVIKQKLCYDIARGLAILHACGIVNGDLKHENVLIFRTTGPASVQQPYTAKLSDFGGAVMDLALRDDLRLPMGTYPFQAPESRKNLTPEGIKKTDVYSFGMLVWRAFIDGISPAAELGLPERKSGSTQAEAELLALKQSDELLLNAICSVQSYAKANKISESAEAVVIYVLGQTAVADPGARSLPHAQAALKGHDTDQIDALLSQAAEKNADLDEQARNNAPGRHGISPDSIGFYRGSIGHDYDAQNDTPGYRPNLPHPEAGEFLFEPLKLKNILDWEQQRRVVHEFEMQAEAPLSLPGSSKALDLQPWKAAYYLFQCYLVEFGTVFNAERACHWLLRASEANDKGDVDYWARAWLWRIHTALDVSMPLRLTELQDYLQWGIARGHRNCIEDGKTIISRLNSSDEKRSWDKALRTGNMILRTIAGGVGMPHFVPRNLRQRYDLNDLSLLAADIIQDLGADYDACLSTSPSPCYLFDKIYVNNQGHGLLHYAATMGNLPALRYLIETYHCTLDLPNQSVYESPLICACRSGRFDCAMYLLSVGANPNGPDLCEETPLHWLCSFPAPRMEILARKLVDSGTEVDWASVSSMRKDVRRINADWEDNFGIPVTPLGRAVVMRSIEAVRVLLGLGADPMKSVGIKGEKQRRSALELAAVLTLPDILEVLLMYVDEKNSQESAPPLFDEVGMLSAAHELRIANYDPTTLQSRLVRCGATYKQDMFRTLQILRKRHHRLQDWRTSHGTTGPDGAALCHEIRLGNIDIVESLLEMGHDVNGSRAHRPIEHAVRLNHTGIFRLLLNRGARLDVRCLAPGASSGVEHTLLQVLAARPRTSRSGTFIAEYLISRARLPLEPVDGGPSALVLAVKNRYFDLADFLLDKGADINCAYVASKHEDWITLLDELLETHTASSLESIEYIFQKSQPTLTKPLTPLHRLALLSPESLTETSQLSLRILHIVLTGFNHHPDAINTSHPALGTPLCIASLLGNAEIASALLDRGADVRAKSRLDLLTPAQCERYGMTELSDVIQRCSRGGETAVSLALLAFEHEISKLETESETEAASSDAHTVAVTDIVPGTLESNIWRKRLRRFEGVLDVLRCTDAWTGEDGKRREELVWRKKGLEDRFVARALGALERFGRGSSEVGDLGVLSRDG